MKAKKNHQARSPQMQAVSAGLQDVLGMTQWRQEHPKATFREIEEAVDQRMNQLRAQMIQDVVQMGESAAWNQRPKEARPQCAMCGKPLSARGQQTRLRANDRRRSDQADAQLWDLPRVWGRLFSPWMRS